MALAVGVVVPVGSEAVASVALGSQMVSTASTLTEPADTLSSGHARNERCAISSWQIKVSFWHIKVSFWHIKMFSR